MSQRTSTQESTLDISNFEWILNISKQDRNTPAFANYITSSDFTELLNACAMSKNKNLFINAPLYANEIFECHGRVTSTDQSAYQPNMLHGNSNIVVAGPLN